MTTVDIPVVREDPRIAPGVVWVAPVGTDPDSDEWRPVGTVDPGTLEIRLTPERVRELPLDTWLRLEATSNVTVTIPRLYPRAVRILCGWTGPVCRFGPRPLGIDGREYARRRRARRRRG